MAEGFFVALIPIGGATAFVAAIAFMIGAAQDAKTAGTKADVVKHVYFYLTAFITLTIVVFASATLLNVAATSWVFTKADSATNYRGTPPPVYLTTAVSTEAKPVEGVVTCANGCELTEQNKQDIANWEAQYQSWKDYSNVGRSKATATVTSLSFLIVGLLAFWFHWRVIRREQRDRADAQPLVTRSIYYWGMSLFGLLMVVIAGGFLLNVLLRTWLYPNLDQGQNSYAVPTPVASERATVDSLINCASACGLTDEQVQLARDWKDDYVAATSVSEVSKTAKRQNDVATSLPFVLVGIPLFAYHWMNIRRRPRLPAVPPTPGASA